MISWLLKRIPVVCKQCSNHLFLRKNYFILLPNEVSDDYQGVEWNTSKSYTLDKLIFISYLATEWRLIYFIFVRVNQKLLSFFFINFTVYYKLQKILHSFERSRLSFLCISTKKKRDFVFNCCWTQIRKVDHFIPCLCILFSWIYLHLDATYVFVIAWPIETKCNQLTISTLEKTLGEGRDGGTLGNAFYRAFYSSIPTFFSC